ncbi:MAG: hypothetical protein AB7F51_09625, partial [Pseudorhodoplanes sp.]
MMMVAAAIRLAIKVSSSRSNSRSSIAPPMSGRLAAALPLSCGFPPCQRKGMTRDFLPTWLLDRSANL